MTLDSRDSAGVRLVALGFVAVIAIAGLVMLFTQTKASVTGNLAGMQRLGTTGTILRTPYEACRAVRNTNPAIGARYVWNGFIDTRNNLIACVDPTDPDNFVKTHYVELQTTHP